MTWVEKERAIQHDTCRYFNSFFNEKCRANVPFSRVKREQGYPCFQSQGCTTICTHASFYTNAEVDAIMREKIEALQKFRAELERRG
jgi:hypothetical protein